MTVDPTPLRTLVVDDEPLAIERLQILCARLPELQLVGTASEGGAALRLIDALSPDLVLLDIAMPGLTGLDVARVLDGRERRPSVIFISAFDAFAVAAFDVAAIDYLLKPVAEDRLARAVRRVRTMLVSAPAARRGTATEFWVPHRAEIIRISAADIDLIEAERDYMRLHVGARSYLVHETITELERRLDPAAFVRLHRSTIVNRARITGLRHDGTGSWTAELIDGRTVRIGRTYLANARALASR